MILEDKTGITPGPWHVMEKGFSKNNDYPTVYATGEELIYVAKCADFLTRKPTDNLANARLISAAPEMLHTLVEYARQIERDNGPGHGNDIISIIEKATGLPWEEIKELK